MKKLFSSILTAMFLIVFPSWSTVHALNSITDDMPSNWASGHIENLRSIPSLDIKVLDNNYKKNITREEFTYLSVKLYEHYTGHEVLDGHICFKDTKDTWVLKAVRAGLVKGYADNTYRPNEYIKREEIASMFVNVFVAADTMYKSPSFELFTDDKKISNWAKRSVYIAKANNIIDGVGGNTFDPTGFTTREQALVMLSKAITSVMPNLLRIPKLGIDRIILREVDSSIQTVTLNNGATNIRVDKTDYTFEPDNSILIGNWDCVDLLSDPLIFVPEKQITPSPYLDTLTFYESGRAEYLTTGNIIITFMWTKGLTMLNYLHEHTSSRYFLATVNDKAYLFLEWKNGDYIYRNAKPHFFVFTKA